MATLDKVRIIVVGDSGKNVEKKNSIKCQNKKHLKFNLPRKIPSFQ